MHPADVVTRRSFEDASRYSIQSRGRGLRVYGPSLSIPRQPTYDAAMSRVHWLLGLLAVGCGLPPDPTPPDYQGLAPSPALTDCDGPLPQGKLRVTHVGTATLVLEIGPFRLITDPALDPAGGKYNFGWGTHSRKLLGPLPSGSKIEAMAFDAALVSHEQHADNLDEPGRRLLDQAAVTITTRKGARRLGDRAVGLRPWETHTLTHPSGQSLRITATPARHGPAGTRPIVGPVIGMLLEWEDRDGAVYISGDTVDYPGLNEIGERTEIDVAFLHLGGVQFPKNTGRMRFTMDAEAAVNAIERLDPRIALPVHYDGWNHFRQPPDEMRRILEASAAGDRIRVLPRGRCVQL